MFEKSKLFFKMFPDIIKVVKKSSELTFGEWKSAVTEGKKEFNELGISKMECLKTLWKELKSNPKEVLSDITDFVSTMSRKTKTVVDRNIETSWEQIAGNKYQGVIPPKPQPPKPQIHHEWGSDRYGGGAYSKVVRF